MRLYRVLIALSAFAALVAGTVAADLVAVNLWGDAHADYVAVSGAGDASCSGAYDCAAVSGTGAARASGPIGFCPLGFPTCQAHLAVSGTGPASACQRDCTGFDGNGLAISGTGDSAGYVAVSGTGDSRSTNIAAVSGTGDCAAGFVAVCGGHAAATYLLAVGGAGASACPFDTSGTIFFVCSAASVSGPAEATNTASVLGDATCPGDRTACVVAASGTGDVECAARLGCVAAVSGTGNARTSGDSLAVAPDGEARVEGNGCAVSLTGRASTGGPSSCQVGCDGSAFYAVRLPGLVPCSDLL